MSLMPCRCRCCRRAATKTVIGDAGVGLERIRAEERARVVDEISAWLMGLEHARENVAACGTDPREVIVMRARRGVYEGIADDVRRKWGVQQKGDER